jgi:hypothetical protein
MVASSGAAVQSGALLVCVTPAWQYVAQVFPPLPFTLHPAPNTLHPTPYTLHPTPYTLHPSPYILAGVRDSCMAVRCPGLPPPSGILRVCDSWGAHRLQSGAWLVCVTPAWQYVAQVFPPLY